jgi:flagellum-specific peptidoglycan hydrolase FlgJ
MRDLLYFQPDAQVPDADLLGIGELVYSDGTTSYVMNDPEIVAGLPPPPPGVTPQKPIGPPPQMQEAPALPLPPVDIGDGSGVQVDMTGTFRGPDGQPLMQAQDFGGQPATPQQAQEFMPTAAAPYQGRGYIPPGDPFGGSAAPAAMAPQSPAGGLQQSAAPPVLQGADGQAYELDITGNFKPATQDPAGMIPVQREGALPPEMAQRQLQALGAQQGATLQATEQARRDEARLMQELTLKQMAANEAERHQREQDIAEQSAKLERWQQEQQAVVDSGIETDLTSATGGPVGAVMLALGATLLGAAGNDMGFRTIERRIDTHVRQQVQRRDTKLGILSNQIGSSMQAVALGKAALYKVAADRVELLAQKTKNDVYEAQTPAVVEQLRQKQLENMQAAETLSIGKTIEKAPPPPAPPNPAMLQKYGELRRERDGSLNIANRAEQQIGLMWSPGKNGQPGHYMNRDEVLKKGIQGVGNLEHWVPDLVYSTMGGVTAEGYQVRGAAEAMAYAQIRQMQPTGPISNADIQAAVKAGALNTEEGLVRGLERIRANAESNQAHDAAQFGPDVVTEYNRRYQQSGGQAQTATPAASRPATAEEMRGAASQLRSTKPGPDPAATLGSAQKLEPAQRMAQVAEDVQAVAGAELPPEGLKILVAQAAHESRNGDSQGAEHNNMFGHKLTGGRKGFNAATTEGEGKNERRVRQNFAAYGSIAEGVADHLSLLKRGYPKAWEALQQGDASAYVAALKDGGYFTGNEDRYRSRILERL